MKKEQHTTGNNEPATQQTTQREKAPVNPFRDAEGTNGPQPSVEEETALEQQRKEALTERD